VDSEVVTPAASDVSLAEFPRAIEWIDDPDAVRAKSTNIVGRLLGEYGVGRPLGGERRLDDRLRRSVARAAKRRIVERRAR